MHSMQDGIVITSPRYGLYPILVRKFGILHIWHTDILLC